MREGIGGLPREEITPLKNRLKLAQIVTAPWQSRLGWDSRRAAIVMGLSLLSTSCARAPSVDILGSFFPVWMVCLTIGVFLTFGLRIVLLRTRLEAEVGPLALFYPCAVTLFTGLLWLIFFR